MYLHLLLCLYAALALNVADARSVRPSRQSECPPFDKSTIVIESYQLYPENADFDLNDCLLYIGFVIYSSSPPPAHVSDNLMLNNAEQSKQVLCTMPP